jgi:hypothetical protein
MLASASRASADAPVGVLPVTIPKTQHTELLNDATGIIINELNVQGITTKTLPPMNPLAVIPNSQQLCAQAGVSALLVPMMRTEQAIHVDHYVLTNIINYATHVEIRLERIGCDGTLLPALIGTGDKSYIFSNVQAGVADAIGRAAKDVAAQYKAHAGDAPASLVQSASPAMQGTQLALVPFSQPGSQDPSLDFATERALKFFNASGVNAVATDPLDFQVAVKSASAICANYKASKIVIGFLRTEQTPRSGGIATHAEAFLTTLDCSGRIIGETDRIGDHLHKGANYRAGVSAAIDDAFGTNAKVDQP